MAYTDRKLWIIGVLGVDGFFAGLLNLADARQTEPKMLDILLAVDQPRHWRLKLSEDEARNTADQLMQLRAECLTEQVPENRTHFLLRHGDAFANLGDFAEALRLYQQAMTVGGSPDQIAMAQFNAGLCLKRLGDLDAAIALFCRAVADPSARVGGKAAANLGTIYKNRNAFPEALRYLELARQLGYPPAELGFAAVREDARIAGVGIPPGNSPYPEN